MAERLRILSVEDSENDLALLVREPWDVVIAD